MGRYALWYTEAMSTAILEAPTREKVVFAPLPRRLSATDYLAMDSAAERKSEFILGDIVPLADATRTHGTIAGNIVSELIYQACERDCDVFFSDTRIRAGGFYYPDAGIVCGDYLVDTLHIDTLTNPTVLIEVLSPSTEHIDRGIKLRDYMRLASLRAYLLVSQDAPRVEQYERGADGD